VLLYRYSPVGNFFTGGLNLQVEHHLFPAICFVHYPAIRKIVAEVGRLYKFNPADPQRRLKAPGFINR
jgi:fatty acid desaturase